MSKYVEKLRELSIGGVIKYIKLENLAEAIIPLPPLNIQIKIADALEKVDSLISLKKEQIKSMDELIQSLFYGMFSNPVSNTKSWKMLPFIEVRTSRLGKILDKKKNTGQYPKKYLRNAETYPTNSPPK